MHDIFDSWCFTVKPRVVQEMAFIWIEDFLLNHPNKKYFFIEASVGSGKANMAITIGNFINSILKGNSCILTPQKILQKQYETIGKFDKVPLASFYGRSNYKCTSKGTNCEIGSQFGKKCKTCPYDKARERALASPLAVMNYDLFLSLKEFSESFQPVKFKALICDEAHRLESFLTEFNVLEWNADKCNFYEIEEYADIKNYDDMIKYFKLVLIPSMTSYLEFMEQEYPYIMGDKTDITKTESKIVEQYNSGSTDVIRMKQLIVMNEDDFEFGHSIITTEKGWKIKHLFGAKNFITYMQPFAEKMVFLSGTFPDIETTAMEMGIPVEECELISLPTTFKKEIRPFIYMPIGKMNNQWNTNTKLKNDMLQAVVDILDNHKEDNGIIHTSSYAISKWLIEELSFLDIPHVLYHHNEGNRDLVIEEFMNNKHEYKVLISPSITEGLDLKQDLGRFAIFVKVPYPYLGDAWVMKRTEISNEWFQKQAVISIVQGAGRVVRDTSDFGVTYMLDETYAQLYRNVRWMFPKYWSEAVYNIEP